MCAAFEENSDARLSASGWIEPSASPLLEADIASVGDELLSSLRDVLSPWSDGPQEMARKLGVEKVLTSRVLKALRGRDPMTAMHAMPGPDPLRRLLRGAAKRGAKPGALDRAAAAVDRFEVLIRDRVGDRSLLDTILSAWVPDARREFELRRKQAAYKAMSQLRGVQTDAIMATVLLYPSATGRHIDVIWVNGLFGLCRVRPGVGVKISTRRLQGADTARRPVSLGGTPVEDLTGLLLPDFCSEPRPRVEVHRIGEVVHYTLADSGFGQGSSVDVVFAEANTAELPRRVPAGSNRRSYFFAEITAPAKLLQFDVLVHEDLYKGQDPSLRLYDTSFDGVASANDASRDIDRLDMLESVEPLGVGASKFRSGDVPRYAELIGHTLGRADWDGVRLRGYRCRIDYPVYGSQVMLTFAAEEELGVP
jgi:hypothetical protein